MIRQFFRRLLQHGGNDPIEQGSEVLQGNCEHPSDGNGVACACGEHTKADDPKKLEMMEQVQENERRINSLVALAEALKKQAIQEPKRS